MESLRILEYQEWFNFLGPPKLEFENQTTVNLDDLKSLTNSVIELGEHAFDDLKYVYEKFEITEMWANISKQGDDHPVHTHLNNLFSGVFYSIGHMLYLLCRGGYVIYIV